MPFWIFGGVGLFWVLILIFFLKDTPPAASAATSQEKATPGEALKAIFSKPTAICVMLGLTMMIYVDFGFKTWMPTFLQEHFHCSLAKAAFTAVLWHYLGAFVGVMAGAHFADKFVKKHHGVRLTTGVIGLAGGIPFIIAMAYAPSLTLCAAAMALFGFFRGIYDSNLFAALFDVVDARYHASATGVVLAMAFVLGSASPTVIGWMFDHMEMTFSVASLSVFYLLGALILLTARLLFIKRDYCA